MPIVVASIIVLLYLFFDVYIYRQILVKKNISAKYRILFVVCSVIAYLAFGVTLLMFKVGTSNSIDFLSMVFLWSSGIFFVNIIPKSIISIFFLLNSLISSITKRKFRALNYVGTVLAVLVVFIFIYGATLGRGQVRVEHTSISSDKIPSSFDGYKIAFFSDLHIGTLVNRDRMLDKLVNEINKQEVDMVLNGGDIVNLSHLELTPEVLDKLKNIEAEDGVFSVMGNHDLGYYYPHSDDLSTDTNTNLLIKKLSSIKWKWLVDSSISIHKGGGTISLTGHRFHGKHGGLDYNIDDIDISHAYDWVDSTDFNITLSHDPRLWDVIVENGIGDITLSGHTHAMQAKLKIGNKAISPAQLIYDRWSGEYKSGKHTLYINDGFGTVFIPVRVGTKPEITIIELKKTN